MELDEALIRQKRLGHLCERHPDRQGRHILAAGEMEMHHMMGTLEVFDVREGQALDPELTGEVLAVMRQLAQEGMTMLVVTHEMGFARNVSSRTVFMENGVVVEEAPSQEFFAHPKEARTREFLQKISHTE